MCRQLDTWMKLNGPTSQMPGASCISLAPFCPFHFTDSHQSQQSSADGQLKYSLTFWKQSNTAFKKVTILHPNIEIHSTQHQDLTSSVSAPSPQPKATIK
ncbi:hypothetical protein KIL84_007372 [Mauremys mutica]|uniref:Uncharacterized protein n=1 Tax=Mauremys mutica TaxID=74926 RepID=A0A9D3X0X9_9SAUR|nr:hypothetical protein KIL84_007372 [Mauremys mutica]